MTPILDFERVGSRPNARRSMSGSGVGSCSSTTVPGPTMVLLALCVAMMACNSKELTRSKATQIIKQNIKFPQMLTDTIPIGEFRVPQPTFEAFMSDPLAGKSYKSLVDAGLVSLHWSRGERSAMLFGGRQSGIVLADLTAKGRLYVVGDNKLVAPTGGQRQITVRMCEKEFDKVTGITMIEGELGSKAKVEYAWKFENQSPFEAVVEASSGSGQCSSNVTHSSAVIMQLYDDGWRIAR
jgi:hypothetical protein